MVTRPEQYVTAEVFIDMFDEYMGWIGKTGGRIYIKDTESGEYKSVMISVDEMKELGLFREDPNPDDL